MSPRKKPFSRADKIAFIGAGKMAEAVISGLLRSKSISPGQITISDIKADRLEYLKSAYKVTPARSAQKAIDGSSIVVLAVKPQNFADLFSGLDLSRTKLVVSIAAGITLSYLEGKVGNKPLIRVMPNNPALVQKGISAIVAGANAREEDVERAKAIFKTVGDVVEVTERDMDAVTGLSGSGPAFVYLFAEAMIEAGESLGLTRSVAERLALQTLLGSAETLIKTKRPPRELKDMVTSPGGTTKAGLDLLEEKGFKQALIDAIMAAAKRSRELSGS